MSSAYSDIMGFWPPILIGEAVDCPTTCTKGSRERYNKRGESGYPCFVPHCNINGGKIRCPVRTLAKGEWYNIQIIVINYVQSQTVSILPPCIATPAYQRLSLRQVKIGHMLPSAASMICSSLLMLSELNHPWMNPVWSALTKEWMILSRCNARPLANNFRSVLSRNISLKLEQSRGSIPNGKIKRIKHKWTHHVPQVILVCTGTRFLSRKLLQMVSLKSTSHLYRFSKNDVKVVLMA